MHRRGYRKWKSERFAKCVMLAVCASVQRERRLWTHQRSRNWWEIIVLQTFTDTQWRENFRMSRQTFHDLCQTFQPYLQGNSIVREALTTEHRLAVTLYFLATNVEYRTIGNLFGIFKSTVCNIVHDVCNAICEELFPTTIVFPEGEDLKEVINGYKTKWHFRICAGAIAATHIPIVAPQYCHADYVNRKGWYSVILQAVCDDKYRFTDICVGWPGRVHDARVFSNSSFRESAEAGNLLPQAPQWIIRVGVPDNQVDMPVVVIGDPAYPMCSWLQKPFTNRATLSADESYFNFRLSSARMTIENTFGRFKGRWRRFLKRIDVDINFVPTMTTAAATLHNICENEKELFDQDWRDGTDTLPVDEAAGEVRVQLDINGATIRRALTNQFAAERNG